MLIAGCQVALGYVGQPELTAQRFRPDPDYPGEQIYDSGDRALWHGGELYYLGRSDGQVKLRGQRLELGDIEMALAAVEGIGAQKGGSSSGVVTGVLGVGAAATVGAGGYAMYRRRKKKNAQQQREASS